MKATVFAELNSLPADFGFEFFNGRLDRSFDYGRFVVRGFQV